MLLLKRAFLNVARTGRATRFSIVSVVRLTCPSVILYKIPRLEYTYVDVTEIMTRNVCSR